MPTFGPRIGRILSGAAAVTLLVGGATTQGSLDSATASPGHTLAAAGGGVTYRMTTHPWPIKDSTGRTYDARHGFTGGWYNGTITGNTDIHGTSDDRTYRPEWVFPQTWSKPVPSGTYDVSLKMRESFFKKAGERVFDVTAEGSRVLQDVDIYKAVGRNRAYDRTFRVTVTDGSLDLKFHAKRNGALVSAIVLTQVLSASAAAPQAPAPARAASFTNLAFHDDFTSLATIDRTATGKPGHLWFTDRPFGWGTTAPESLSASNSVLTINQTTKSPNYGIGTVSPTSKEGRGFTFGYFEARLSFDPSNSTRSEGWPSFWGLSKDHIAGRPSRPRSAELDFFEAYNDPGQPFENIFAGTLHDWSLDGAEVDRGSYGNNVHRLDKVDFTQWHTYGCLWQPGKVTWYFDGKPIHTQTYSADAPPVPNTGNHAAGTFSNLDSDPEGQALILGSGVNYPLKVDWVRVWQ